MITKRKKAPLVHKKQSCVLYVQYVHPNDVKVMRIRTAVRSVRGKAAASTWCGVALELAEPGAYVSCHAARCVLFFRHADSNSCSLVR
jgi:hypothetical protein